MDPERYLRNGEEAYVLGCISNCLYSTMVESGRTKKECTFLKRRLPFDNVQSQMEDICSARLGARFDAIGGLDIYYHVTKRRPDLPDSDPHFKLVCKSFQVTDSTRAEFVRSLCQRYEDFMAECENLGMTKTNKNLKTLRSSVTKLLSLAL